MSNTLKKGLTAEKKKELNEKLMVNGLSGIPMEKYSLYLFPNSKISNEGVLCDFRQLKEKTIDLIKSIFGIDFEIDVRFNSEDVEVYKSGDYGCCQLVPYNKLFKTL